MFEMDKDISQFLSRKIAFPAEYVSRISADKLLLDKKSICEQKLVGIF